MKKKWLLIPLLSFVLVLILFKYVLYIGYVPTTSMEPTIMAGDKIIGVRILGELEVGDIVVFKYDDTYMVKRIAAVQGDAILGGSKVPDNCYYVLGDNHLNSHDSKHWENPFLHRDCIIAKISICLP